MNDPDRNPMGLTPVVEPQFILFEVNGSNFSDLGTRPFDEPQAMLDGRIDLFAADSTTTTHTDNEWFQGFCRGCDYWQSTH
jgi:hypothetical protein